MDISSNFDSGNIEVVDTSDPEHIRLNLRRDSNSEFMQWFHFRVRGAQNQTVNFHIENADQAAYVDGWPDYQAVASYDRQHWFRVQTKYADGKLSIHHRPDENSVYYAYFAPYSHERHQDLLASASSHPLCTLLSLGKTVDGRDLDALMIGTPAPVKATYWIIARQHPGESMAEWLMEGLLGRLLDQDDATAKTLLNHATFYLVPNMNPDGSARGNLRANAAGANLNREWASPTPEHSPEVLAVEQMMQETGVDFFLDVHGDEALPYVFVAGSEGNPGYSERLDRLGENFKTALKAASPDFQDEFGYDKEAPKTSDLKKATNWVSETFDCLGYTLEMPFKDNINLPDPVMGWSPARSELLGRDILTAINAVRDQLR